MADHEKRMCEECGEKEATCLMNMMIQGQSVKRWLCNGCLTKIRMDLSANNAQRVLGAILQAISGQKRPETPKKPEPLPVVPPEFDLKCEKCGMMLSTANQTGRLGCPNCYEAFREELAPLLQQLHGRVQHAGRRPLDNDDALQRRETIDQLNRAMAKAVAEEDYESAAHFRDQLKALEGQEGGEG